MFLSNFPGNIWVGIAQKMESSIAFTENTSPLVLASTRFNTRKVKKASLAIRNSIVTNPSVGIFEFDQAQYVLELVAIKRFIGQNPSGTVRREKSEAFLAVEFFRAIVAISEFYKVTPIIIVRYPPGVTQVPFRKCF